MVFYIMIGLVVACVVLEYLESCLEKERANAEANERVKIEEEKEKAEAEYESNRTGFIPASSMLEISKNAEPGVDIEFRKEYEKVSEEKLKELLEEMQDVAKNGGKSIHVKQCDDYFSEGMYDYLWKYEILYKDGTLKKLGYTLKSDDPLYTVPGFPQLY